MLYNFNAFEREYFFIIIGLDRILFHQITIAVVKIQSNCLYNNTPQGHNFFGKPGI